MPANGEFPPLVPSTLDKLHNLATNIDRLSIHQYHNVLRAVEAPRDTKGLYQVQDPIMPVSLQFIRDPATGKILRYQEVESFSFGETAKNSLSLTRAPGTSAEQVKGNSTNLPFWPGGFEEVKHRDFTEDISRDLGLDESEIAEELFSGPDLAKSPPGFPMMTIEFDEDLAPGDKAKIPPPDEMEEELNFWNVVPKSSVLPAGLEKSPDEDNSQAYELSDDLMVLSLEEDDDDQALKPPVLQIKDAPTFVGGNKRKWAEMVDVSKPMSDFHEKVPDMAFKYPFELDTFQRQAIVRLEEHENVFVAAHTSAGKTVVAEYAIALSVRHMTKTVYTSPIKALSNQKFRDFKNNFDSVGLITGDVQINPTASCLIMTTEILRSMLYNGSDTIRDLEWVVFDEIHYLNNAERGHVWEETLIMLPDHVSIIMLSATVPNALEFANWVGGIKKKKIYVISTAKRPVPLEHHLYTGTGGKSKHEQFRIMEGSSAFSRVEYTKAKEAKEGRKSKHDKSFGPRGGNFQFNENFERNLYIGLIDHLKTRDQLPVVVFAFSRNKCDTYANMLSSSIDLCTGAQKAEVHSFFQKSINRLKGSDRELPQVLSLQAMLKNGIGVHHSGILPILKEVVEMLFQRGLVKFLFATETFAMGVNMPARTVVFDTIRKHDGMCFRNLNPAEYIQMAGRAGRRGLDTTGTVLILCKQMVPSEQDLKGMMEGKAAELSSQFRLTYSMILNLLRVETLTVEDVMKRSFLEAGSETLNKEAMQDRLQRVTSKIEELDFEPRDKFLSHQYDLTKEFLKVWEVVTPDVYSYPKFARMLQTGTFIVFESLPQITARIGLILSFSSDPKTKAKRIKVIHITSDEDRNRQLDKNFNIMTFPGIEALEAAQEKNKDQLQKKFAQYLYYAHDKLIDFVPVKDDNLPELAVTEILTSNIVDITKESTPVRLEIVRNYIENRRIMKSSGREEISGSMDTTMEVMNKLINISHDYAARSYSFEPILPAVGARGVDPQLFDRFKKLDELGVKMKKINYRDSVPNFLQQFREVFYYMSLIDEREYLNYMLSPRSLRLHGEYQARIEVLRELGYIDSENLVQLKGRVACEMGNQNELMMTEIIFNNVLSDCPPSEVAALLSCMVFEAKHIPEPKMASDSRLRQKIEAIKAQARTIGDIQKNKGVSESTDAFVEQFKFGLIEVVYEWAQGKPFSNIMNLTEVQEGIIVRTIQRLDEMLKDVKDAARIIGEPTLKKKMEEASECIKRDIVFAASLYTQ